MSWAGARLYEYRDAQFGLACLKSATAKRVGVSYDGKELTFRVSSTESSNGSHPATVWRIEGDCEGRKEYRSFKEALHFVCDHLLEINEGTP